MFTSFAVSLGGIDRRLFRAKSLPIPLRKISREEYRERQECEELEITFDFKTLEKYIGDLRVRERLRVAF